MFLYGASGHAKVIIDILRKKGIKINGLFDDNPTITELAGIKCFGKFNKSLLGNDEIIISIGDNVIRQKIVNNFSSGVKFGSAIDISAIISENVKIAEGTVVMPGAVINIDTEIGKHTIINTTASVDHECVIGNYAHISPNVTLCGNVSVGDLSHIGAGAVVIPNIKIGKNVMVGAGTVVTKNISDNCIVVGNPGRVIKHK